MIKIDFQNIEENLKTCGISKTIEEIASIDYPLIISGIPDNWYDDFRRHGFDEYAVFQDYWVDSLTVPGDRYDDYEFLHKNDCAVASEISLACRGQSRGFEGESPDWFADWLDGEEGLNNTAVLICKTNNRIAGISCTATYAHESEKGAVVWVRMMAVHPKFQGQGIDTRLLMQTRQYGAKHGAKRAFLHTDTQNKNAIKMYRKAGFQPQINEKQIDMIWRERHGY